MQHTAEYTFSAGKWLLLLLFNAHLKVVYFELIRFILVNLAFFGRVTQQDSSQCDQ